LAELGQLLGLHRNNRTLMARRQVSRWSLGKIDVALLKQVSPIEWDSVSVPMESYIGWGPTPRWTEPENSTPR
jgi:hypothetical protein